MAPYKVDRNVIKQSLTWKEVIDNLNNSYVNNKEFKSNSEGFFASFEAHHIPKVKKIMKKLNAVDAHLYVSLLINAPTLGRHSDTMGVKYWQALGSTEWQFDDGNKIILKEGDLITVGREVYHATRPLSARAGISFGFYD